VKTTVKKPNCFTQAQWDYYKQDVPFVKNGKTLDVCFDCTVEYQRKMTKEGKCEFPMKRLDKVVEYV
jgi:hypothetical protein